MYTTPGGLSLGVWLVTQRRVREGQIQGNLTEQQIERLDSIGMVWGNRKEIAWQHGFEVAKKYHDTYGNLMVVRKYVDPDGYPFGAVDHQDPAAKAEWPLEGRTHCAA